MNASAATRMMILGVFMAPSENAGREQGVFDL
jgi:hypothetical protein